MIDFACKKFSLEEVIKCSLGLTKSELEIMKVFIGKNKLFFSTGEISKLTKLDLTTVQRAVKKIYDLGLIERSQTNLAEGGYSFSYKLKSKSEVKKKVTLIVNNWANRVGDEFDKW